MRGKKNNHAVCYDNRDIQRSKIMAEPSLNNLNKHIRAHFKLHSKSLVSMGDMLHLEVMIDLK